MQKPRNFLGLRTPDPRRSSLGGAMRHLARALFWWEIVCATRVPCKAIVIKVLQNKSQQNYNGPRTQDPGPRTQDPGPCTLHPAPCTLHPAPWSLNPALGGPSTSTPSSTLYTATCTRLHYYFLFLLHTLYACYRYTFCTTTALPQFFRCIIERFFVCR